MSSQIRLGIYNPQLSALSSLEAIFVGKERLLSELVDRHQHPGCFTLLCGPNGSGKTHLLRLFAKRLKEQLNTSIQRQIIAVDLAQGELSDLLDLLLAIITELGLSDRPDIEGSSKKLEQSLLGQFQAYCANLPVTLLIENFDSHLALLSAAEQKKLFDLLTNTQGVNVFATGCEFAPTHSKVLSLFEHKPLTPLSLEEAIVLMIKVAELENKIDVVNALKSPKGKTSIEALHHLMSGIPRHYVNFTSLLNGDPLEQFSDILAQMLDALSPQFHQQLQLLPSQQQKIFNYICRQGGTVSVGNIAKNNRLTHQTTSGQLKKLKTKNLVNATSVGRNSHYEAAEPLMRLSMALGKQTQQKQLSSIEFIRQWFASGSAGYLANDGHCFIYHKHWLIEKYVPRQVPLLLPIQITIDRFLTQLPNEITTELELLRQEISNVQQQLLGGEQQQKSDHLELLYALATKSWQSQQYDAAILLTEDIFAFAQKAADAKLWKQLCQLNIGITALFAYSEHIEHTLPWFDLLEKQEPKLSSQAFSIALSQCLVSKAKGYAIANNPGKTQQCLEQLRIRAEKRNNLEIAGAFCHGIKETISLFATSDTKLAEKYLRQVQDKAYKYHLEDLVFACACRLWARTADTMPLDGVIKKMDQVREMEGFSYEIYLMLYELAMQPVNIQVTGYLALWQALEQSKQQGIFAAALNQVSVNLAKNAPKRFDIWLDGCLTLLDGQPSLKQSRRLLFAMQQYLQQGFDESQLLALPKEERKLVLQALQRE